MSSSRYKADLFLEFAEKLILDGRYEEKSRSRVVVGRAYYTAFLKAKKRLGELGYQLNSTLTIHKQVIEALTKLKPDLGDKFSGLFDKRVDADYHMDIDIRKDTGKSSIKTAQIIISELPKLK